jgi:bifunctional ADP-heptose synthase (sugar kinase/adenylyltransferase)
VKKHDANERLVPVLEALSDITVTVVADFVSGERKCAGLAAAATLAQVGVNVFPVGVVGEDAAGRQIQHRLQELHISTSGVDRIKKYSTPRAEQVAGVELLHGEHPALLNLIEHARKFASASEAMYLCDHGFGAASPRALNFIKSNGCVREKTLAARSTARLADFEQLSAAIGTAAEMEKAIDIEIGESAEKLRVAGDGMKQELKVDVFLAVGNDSLLAFSDRHKPMSFEIAEPFSSADVDVLGAIFAAALATDADAADAAQLAAQVTLFLRRESAVAQRERREALIEFLSGKSAVRSR